MLHKEPKNSIDVLLIGSSATYSGFSSVYAYEQFGFTSFPYSIGGSTCTSWKPAVQDALCNQKPKLIIVDVFGGGYDSELIKTRNNQIYTIMSHTSLSAEKIKTSKELSRAVEDTSIFSLLFPLAKYHSSVPSNLMSFKDSLRAFHSDTSKLKGVEIITRARKLASVDNASFSDDTIPLDKDTEGIILDFIDYCKEQKLNVLFVKYPTVLTQNNPDELEVNLRSNRILELAGQAGFATLNLQKCFHEIGLVESEDYYNHGHTNTRGQKKITRYLGAYIQNNLGIPPSSFDESTKKAWDDCVPYYRAYCELAEKYIISNNFVNLGDCPALVDNLRQIVGDS